MKPQPRWILLWVTIGGSAALSWEILWQIQATLALGVSAFGTAVVLAAAMGGMALGSLAMGRWLRDRAPERPLRLYAWLELAIGISGLGLPAGFSALESLDSWLYGVAPTLAPALQIAGIALLLAPPTCAMGASLPVFAAVSRAHGVSLSVLYAFNTAGAALGVLGLSFALLPALGVFRSSLLVAALNLAVFAAARWIPFQVASAPEAEGGAPVSTPRRTQGLSPRFAALLVFASGFVTFALEVVWFRSLRAAFQSTTESFAIMLVSVLLPLAVGARAVPWLRRRGVGLGAVVALAGLAILLATPGVERIDLFASRDPRYLLRLFEWMALSLALLGPAVLCLGMLLPWCLEEFSAPTDAARLYALNTLGAVLGALIGAWGLLPGLGAARSAWLLGVAVVGLAAWSARAPLRWGVLAAGVAALGLAVGGTASLGRERVQNPHALAGAKILAFDEGPDFTVSVLEGEAGRLLLIDGFIASSERGESSYMAWMGRLPMLLHPDPKRALVICFGTGQTAHGVREAGLEVLDVVDVSAAVLAMAPHFARNRGVLEDPRVHSRVMDGRAWIRRTRVRYDVVTLEPMSPYFAGVNALYSLEFYERVASRLAPGAVVAQWVPFHILPPRYAASVAATFVEVFPDALLWLDPSSQTGILLGRAATEGPPLGSDWPGLSRAGVDGSNADRIRGAVALGPEALARYARGATPITDDNQLLAYSLIPRAYSRFGSFAAMAEANLELLSRQQD